VNFLDEVQHEWMVGVSACFQCLMHVVYILSVCQKPGQTSSSRGHCELIQF